MNSVFGEGFVESYIPDYDTITYTVTIEGEDFRITIPTEEFFDPKWKKVLDLQPHNLYNIFIEIEKESLKKSTGCLLQLKGWRFHEPFVALSDLRVNCSVAGRR